MGLMYVPVVCMVLTGLSSIALDFSSSHTATLILASIVVSVAGMCISLTAGIAVELFPTNIRYVQRIQTERKCSEFQSRNICEVILCSYAMPFVTVGWL